MDILHNLQIQLKQDSIGVLLMSISKCKTVMISLYLGLNYLMNCFYFIIDIIKEAKVWSDCLYADYITRINSLFKEC